MSDIKDGAATPGQAATLAELLDGWREELAEEPMYPDQHVVHATLSTVVEQLEAAIAAREPHAATGLPREQWAEPKAAPGEPLGPYRRCTRWSHPADDFYGQCVTYAGHDGEHENEHGIRWAGPRWPSPDEMAAPARADEFARVKVRLSALVASLDETVNRGTHAEEFDQGAAHASAVTARQLREILNDTALGTTPKAAPEQLRAALEATLADWRDDAVYRLTDTRDEMSEHHAVTGCADTLAAILADHPDAGPKAAPELADDGTTAGQRAHRRWHEVRWPDSGPVEIAKEWEILSDRAKAAWEAAGVGDVRRELGDRLRETAADNIRLREVITRAGLPS